MDEAYSSSAIEDASSTREKAHPLILSGKAPEIRVGRVIVNNYRTLRFVLEHPDAAD